MVDGLEEVSKIKLKIVKKRVAKYESRATPIWLSSVLCVKKAKK